MPRWQAHARHILECVRKIDHIQQRGSILDDEILYAAALRHLQTMAESCQKLPDALKDAEPEIPWRDISGFRNILVHNYLGEIDPMSIDAVIRKHLPELEQAVRRMLEIDPPDRDDPRHAP